MHFTLEHVQQARIKGQTEGYAKGRGGPHNTHKTHKTHKTYKS
jgi:hypothetical protein